MNRRRSIGGASYAQEMKKNFCSPSNYCYGTDFSSLRADEKGVCGRGSISVCPTCSNVLNDKFYYSNEKGQPLKKESYLNRERFNSIPPIKLKFYGDRYQFMNRLEDSKQSHNEGFRNRPRRYSGGDDNFPAGLIIDRAPENKKIPLNQKNLEILQDSLSRRNKKFELHSSITHLPKTIAAVRTGAWKRQADVERLKESEPMSNKSLHDHSRVDSLFNRVPNSNSSLIPESKYKLILNSNINCNRKIDRAIKLDTKMDSYVATLSSRTNDPNNSRMRSYILTSSPSKSPTLLHPGLLKSPRNYPEKLRSYSDDEDNNLRDQNNYKRKLSCFNNNTFVNCPKQKTLPILHPSLSRKLPLQQSNKIIYNRFGTDERRTQREKIDRLYKNEGFDFQNHRKSLTGVNTY